MLIVLLLLPVLRFSAAPQVGPQTSVKAEKREFSLNNFCCCNYNYLLEFYILFTLVSKF